ncbi:homeobox-leucine zipper protein ANTHOCYANINLESS 2-like [Gastrolobium bilobum]|uniref:homeobox-leucine zipper protein ANTHOCYANINLESS 2-like n=1 Tax=Gastrolobium bilobum TaxID=150636 RepID=UPI002AB04249|nr:homeobox-leucine zipper protein ANTHOCYANINLESS 2-like [Gastrolobium bilobum]
MGFEGLISSNSSNSGGGGARVVADSSSKNHFMHSVSIVESPLFSPPITISKQNFSTMFLSTQRKMEGHDQMALIGENFENGLMGRMRDDENESRSGSDNFEGGSGDDQDAGDNTPQRKKKYHRHTPQQIQELESFFKDCPHPDEKQRSDLGKKLGLENKQIKFWFQNRRTQMKTQLERHENMILKQENDKLRAENTMMREAIENPICNNCGGHAIPGRISMSGIRPPMGLIGNRVQIDPSMLVNLAASAMDELIGMTQIDNSLWIKSSDGGKEVLNHEEYARMSSIYNGTKPIGYATEATRETGLVLINSLALVDSLMDAITWIDHSQYDESVIPQLYRRLVSSGIGFGAQRWIATLQRQCQCLAILSSPSIRAENPKALVGQPGMKSLLKLTQRMTECFYSGICASSTRKWEIIPLATLGDDIKVMTRKNVWMPVSRQRLFDFLREARTRRHWDDLASDVTVNEIHSIVKGEGQGNCISILRANSGVRHWYSTRVRKDLQPL